MPDQQTAAPLVQVSLGERERLIDPNARAPQHHDQTPHPPSVTAVSSLAHDRDDFVDRRRVRRVPAALVRRDPASVMAGHRRRRPGAASGVHN